MPTVLPEPGRGFALELCGKTEIYATKIRIFSELHQRYVNQKKQQKMGFNRDLNPGPPAD